MLYNISVTPLDFSIIIPTLNGSKYIEKLLSSIKVSIDRFHVEIIIIDSGSSDKTLSIIRNFTKEYSNIKIFKIKKQQFNHGATRNLGVQKAKGKYVLFISQDAL